jgi:hypothetical protein
MGRCSPRRGSQACSGSTALGPAQGTTGARRATSRTRHAARATRGRCSVRFLPTGLSRRALLGAARPRAPHRRGKRRDRAKSWHARPRDPLRPRRQSCTGSLRCALVGPLPLARARDAAHGAQRAGLRARERPQAPGAARHRSVLLGALVRWLCRHPTCAVWRCADAPAADLAVAPRLAAARAHRPRRRTAALPPKIVVDLTASRPRTDDGSEHALAPPRRHDAPTTLGRTRRLGSNTPLSRQPVHASKASRHTLHHRSSHHRPKTTAQAPRSPEAPSAESK